MNKSSSTAAHHPHHHQQQGPANCSSTDRSSSSSIFVPEDAPVYDIPVSAINRPLQSAVDPSKVAQFAQEMAAGAQFTPIEVIHVQGGC